MLTWGEMFGLTDGDCSHPANVRMVANEMTPPVEAASAIALVTHWGMVGSSPEKTGGSMLYWVSRSKYELHTSAVVMASRSSWEGIVVPSPASVVRHWSRSRRPSRGRGRCW